MAKVTAAWGIDIGQCGLKALRCHLDPQDPGKAVADAFDYIEYPSILSQPEVDPVELVRDALNTFLERNDLRGAKMAVSVSGQSGLARFIKLPPVETKKIPDIVRYEANQQIPFDLEDVIWDYQRMFGGGEEDGFAVETEVGLFAMKRDQVYQEIAPYREVGIDIDVVQLTPLAIYNYIVFDQIGELPPEEDFDPDDPPESMVVLSIGTESTDLVITNGFRVWQRSVPLGGSHFTKALVKELQHTYVAAEHEKRHATEAADPKAIYQAMRPVFKDLLTEIQRSIGYFQSLDRSAKIGKVLALGNSMKLPGLKRFFSQNLGHEVTEIKSFATLSGGAVTAAPAFKENILSFGVAYGLALQGLGAARLKTNLVPQEIVLDRAINRKKPWAVAASVLLALGCLINFAILWWPWYQIRVDADENWKDAQTASAQVEREVNAWADGHKDADKTYQDGIDLGNQLVAHFDRRTDWLNLCQAVYQCLPTDPEGGAERDFHSRQQLWITDMRSYHFEDLAQWYTEETEQKYTTFLQKIMVQATAGASARFDAAAQLVGDEQTDVAGPKERTILPRDPQFPSTGKPSGPGFVIQLTGYHFHNSDEHANADHFVRRTLVHNLQDKVIKLPDGKGGEVEYSVNELGISHPLVFEMLPNKIVLAPRADGGGADGAPTQLVQYQFVVQFAWSPKPLVPKEKPKFAATAPAGRAAARQP